MGGVRGDSAREERAGTGGDGAAGRQGDRKIAGDELETRRQAADRQIKIEGDHAIMVYLSDLRHERSNSDEEDGGVGGNTDENVQGTDEGRSVFREREEDSDERDVDEPEEVQRRRPVVVLPRQLYRWCWHSLTKGQTTEDDERRCSCGAGFVSGGHGERRGEARTRVSGVGGAQVEVAAALHLHWFSRFGRCRVLISDNGNEFKNRYLGSNADVPGNRAPVSLGVQPEGDAWGEDDDEEDVGWDAFVGGKKEVLQKIRESIEDTIAATTGTGRGGRWSDGRGATHDRSEESLQGESEARRRRQTERVAVRRGELA